MRRVTRAFVLSIGLVPAVLLGQSTSNLDEYNALLARYRVMRPSMSATKRAEMDRLFADLAASYSVVRTPSSVGRLSRNPYIEGSTSSGLSKYNADSPANPYGQYGSKYSPTGARNRYANDGLDIIGADGEYLGKLNSNPFDPNSIANPYGRYGSKYSSSSVNNPYSAYGSKYSPLSARNPYASDPPRLYAPRSPYDSIYRRQ